MSNGITNASEKLSVSEYSKEIKNIEKQISGLFESIQECNDISEETKEFPVLDTVSYALLKKIEEMIYEEENCSNVRTCTYRNNDADCLWKQERQ